MIPDEILIVGNIMGIYQDEGHSGLHSMDNINKATIQIFYINYVQLNWFVYLYIKFGITKTQITTSD